MNTKKLNTLFLWFIATFLFVYVLFLGKTMFISLLFTFFLFILLSSAFDFFWKYTKNSILSVLLTGTSCFVFFLLIYFILSSQIDSFSQEIPRYKDIFLGAGEFIKTFTGRDINLGSLVDSIDFSKIFSGFWAFVSNFLGYVGTILFFLIFLFLEKKYFVKKVEKIFDNATEKKFFKIVEKIHADLTLYFGVKFLMAFLNAFVSYIVMLAFWLEYALFFALLVFLLDFIPNIGGIIALSFPFLYSFLQFSSPFTAFLLLLFLIVPQTITWNIIEPKLYGSRLNLSGFVILLSLLFWGSLWGIVGAFLAVPLMTSLNIIFSKFEATKPLAIILSEKGNVQ